eukprot:CAMPEP_0198201200 /NCGR_PEP_ID=MMETSP1445-20131203/3962_1 /TAXON_ID=36898 /ORGANISM="Pyramimonas sp., Strain CCMP2087" /LENGTH=479 /DNA_ID=CAMNT_0043871403 /DNA_START=51 /DNA_END=1490 /DNA_ORIENTATION=+
MSAMLGINNLVTVVPKVVKIDAKATRARASAKGYVGLKPASLFNKPPASPAFTVSNGCTTTASMKVWTPVNNKFFETLSFLPPLSDAEIVKQIGYIVAKDWTPCVEFAAPENALTLDHGHDGIVSSATCGYYANRYWPMWKLPMFGCTDPNQVLAEIAKCKTAFPDAYVRVCGFDPIKQVQVTSMLVHRPPNEPAIPVQARSVGGTEAAGGYATSPPSPSPPLLPPQQPSPEETLPRIVDLDYFAFDKLTPKGPRTRVHDGDPHDFTRKFTAVGGAATGSWACTEGGWDSPAPRATTEFFYVFSGSGAVTDPDGTSHHFRGGDIVVLPKGWYGSWDIIHKIHKVWVVNDHADVAHASTVPLVFRAAPFASLWATIGGGGLKLRKDALHGAPASAASEMYDVGNTSVGLWTCTPGSFASVKTTTEFFHVLEGVFFLTNTDGTARRCVAGDTVVLPKGWAGMWDVIETVKKVWVDISDPAE